MNEVLTYKHSAPSVRLQDKERDRYRHPVEADLRPEEQLTREIVRIKARGEENVYMLPDTGFQIKTQISLLLENYKNGVPFADSFQQIEQDVQGFKTEYLVEQPVFPIVFQKAKHQGKTRLVGKLYGGKPLVDVTDAREREGSVKRSIQKIEDYLLYAGSGAMAVMTSPKGWSGYDGITYPDSQTYCFQVQEDGGIRGFTLKTDINLSQNEELLSRLGVSKEAFSTNVDSQTGIKRIVENVAFIDPNENKSIEDIAQIIKQIKKSEVAYTDSQGIPRTFAEMQKLLREPEPLWTIDDTVKTLTDRFKEYVSYRIIAQDEQMVRDISVALGYTVLKLMHEVRPPVKKQTMKQDKTYDLVALPLSVFDPRDTLEEMQKIAGCAGGGSSNIVDSITPRLFTTEGSMTAEEAKKDPKLCRCKAGGEEPHFHCDGSKEGTEGSEKCNHAIQVGKGITKCPSCGEGKKC